ncbi:diguanylate cyclase (GGDEF)-like protein [Brockia lithotrophica]|uniref:Diguanylate cyclase (GGDEF)-like protein n=1 Tax=Brockia lithotrophica TaxID=933949 RepID=A0A660L5A0_9BACL|nr:diguanylate cyclase (GGDEF)-like protein [Brockia lithotrophica]
MGPDAVGKGEGRVAAFLYAAGIAFLGLAFYVGGEGGGAFGGVWRTTAIVPVLLWVAAPLLGWLSFVDRRVYFFWDAAPALFLLYVYGPFAEFFFGQLVAAGAILGIRPHGARKAFTLPALFAAMSVFAATGLWFVKFAYAPGSTPTFFSPGPAVSSLGESLAVTAVLLFFRVAGMFACCGIGHRYVAAHASFWRGRTAPPSVRPWVVVVLLFAYGWSVFALFTFPTGEDVWWFTALLFVGWGTYLLLAAGARRLLAVWQEKESYRLYLLASRGLRRELELSRVAEEAARVAARFFPRRRLVVRVYSTGTRQQAYLEVREDGTHEFSLRSEPLAALPSPWEKGEEVRPITTLEGEEALFLPFTGSGRSSPGKGGSPSEGSGEAGGGVYGYVFLYGARAFSTAGTELFLTLFGQDLGNAFSLAFAYYDVVKRQNEDPLTGLPNYRALDRDFTVFRALGERGMPIALLMVDIDRFKPVNDTFGHLAGDIVLRKIAQVLKEFAERRGGYAYRYGGEEFVLVFPGYTEAEAALVAEELRAEVAATPVSFPNFLGGGDLVTLHRTVSIGVAAYPESAEELEDLVRNADRAMYFGAKFRGRNRVGRYSLHVSAESDDA